MSLPLEEITLPQVLLKEGYRTATVGKMHLAPLLKGWGEPSPESKEYWESGRRLPLPYYGFEQVRLHCSHGPGDFADYYHYLVSIDPKLPDLLKKENALETPSGAPSSWKSAIPVQYHASNWIADEATHFLRDFARYKEPFMLFVSFPDPHFPFCPPAPYCSQYKPSEMLMPKRSPREEEFGSPIYRWRLKRFSQAFGYHPMQMPEAHIREIIAHYYGMISLMDQAIGRILAQLEESGLEKNTLVLFTTDHGEHLGDHWLIYKAQHYDELFHLPFLLRLPGRIPAGKRLQGFYSFVDVVPTLLELLNVKAPLGVQGRSFAQALFGGSERPRSAILIEDDDPGTPEYWRTIWTDRFRLTLMGGNLQRYGVSGHTGELFNLHEDPSEFRNLYDEPQHRSLRGELAEQMADIFFREFDPIPPKTAEA